MPDTAVHRAFRTIGPWVAAALLGLSAPHLQAKGSLDSANTAEVALAELPLQARTTYRLIRKGGPFAYEKDGLVFGNRERLLPAKKRGHYREYTVKTPWSRDRGARRIVCGGVPPTQPEVCYYTSDHYNSFRKITP